MADLSWRTGSIFSCCKGLWDCRVLKPITSKHQSVFWLVSQSRRMSAICVGICRWISLAAASADPVLAPEQKSCWLIAKLGRTQTIIYIVVWVRPSFAMRQQDFGCGASVRLTYAGSMILVSGTYQCTLIDEITRQRQRKC